MSNLLKRALGLVYAVENERNVELRGVKAESLGRDIMKLWGSSRVEKYMFDQISGKYISFPKFFAPDVHYILTRVLQYKGAHTSRGAIKSALRELEENTWLKNITEDHPDILDMSQVSHFKKRPLPHQVSFLEAFNHRVPRYGLLGYLLAAGAGTGKAQPLSAMIKTPGGWTTMGEVKTGDTITAWDGTPTKVLATYPQGEIPVYRVTFADGRSTECCENHLWRVCNNRKRPHLQWSVINTVEMMRLLDETGGRVHIQLIEPEQTPDVSLPLNPYLMGVLLGDGSFSAGTPSITKGNPQLFELISTMLPPGSELVQRTEEITYAVSRTAESGANPLTDILRELKLYGLTSPQKFIPKQFLHASVEQRLSLLQGLMDTDGTAASEGISEIRGQKPGAFFTA